MKEELSLIEKIYEINPELNGQLTDIVSGVIELNSKIGKLGLPIWVSAKPLKQRMLNFTKLQQEYISGICETMMQDGNSMNLEYEQSVLLQSKAYSFQ